VSRLRRPRLTIAVADEERSSASLRNPVIGRTEDPGPVAVAELLKIPAELSPQSLDSRDGYLLASDPPRTNDLDPPRNLEHEGAGLPI
jgi:hypothetical protein